MGDTTDELIELAKGINANPYQYTREMDMLLTTGEQVSIALLTMAFKTPLKSGDEFVSKLYLRKEGIKYVFYQDIFRLPDLKPVIKSTVETVCLVHGRLSDSPFFDELFADYLNPPQT